MIFDDSLRAFLTDKVEFFQQNPDRLIISVEKGSLKWAGVGLSHVQHYQLLIEVDEWPERLDANTVIVPMLDWYQKNQDPIAHDAPSPLTFESYILSNYTTTVVFALKVAEVVRVSTDDTGNYVFASCPNTNHIDNLIKTMSNLDDLAGVLPEWVAGIASQLDNKELKKVNRALAVELRGINRDRIRAQTDPDGSRFVSPLKSENNPMFRELTKARHLKFKATSRYAQIGFKGSAAQIALIHHEGRRSTVRPDSSKKFPYPKRELIGIANADRRIIIRVLRESLTTD